MMNIQKMMQQAQAMQQKLGEMQEMFKDILVAGESGGGAVKVTMTCDGRVKTLDVDASVEDDKETRNDLIVAAINNATEAKEARIQEETQKAMDGMGLPPSTKLPF